MIEPRVFKVLVCRLCYFQAGSRRPIDLANPAKIFCGYWGKPKIDTEAGTCLTKTEDHGKRELLRG